MKETRKTEEMEEIGKPEELESDESEYYSGKCSECSQYNTGRGWCHPCNAKQFQNEFDEWTSGDREIDKFIQQTQLSANKCKEIIEWISFDRLENVTYLAKGGFGTVYKADWLDGVIKVSEVDWYRNGKQVVCLKSLDNLTNKNDFLQEVKNQLKFRGKKSIAIYGITKNPSKNEYMMEIIEWISFDRLENVTYLAKGGFGTVYKADWLDGVIKVSEVDWYRNGKQVVCLKSLDNLTNKNDFLQEVKNQLKFRGKKSIAIYGITKNPSKNEYMMVMNYAKYGSLRKVLNNRFEKLSWQRKFYILSDIAQGLKNIHEMGLMHKDFHPGNIVNPVLTLSYITDFGLCKPVTKNDPEKIYGVIPYMAPETLSRGEYTQASDIYSFGMIMLEVLTSYPPYYNVPHNTNLVIDICKGRKPEIKYEIPRFFKEIMEKCWNFEPPNRLTAKELESQLNSYSYGGKIRRQIKAANKSNKSFIKYDPNEIHPEAIYTSRLIPKTTIPGYDTFDSRQNFFSIPDNIIVEDDETQEME
ncbi:hypothetical protein Glove_320g137 [Diversispora epigaea]|uniref:Protein kinase domain-containing protein n=1 Tax=Diversispora epigaea TaxID=1348612 RepID=A0A397HUK5_9GLOM|nr:hypothetical protein Glove_320g137 [Diversispora epigaea]